MHNDKGEEMSVNPYSCKGCIHNADKESAKTWHGCNHPEAVENAGKFFGKKDIVNNRIWCYAKNNN